jgi:hypothetical protein
MKGMLEVRELAAYHPYILRHSFATECSHAGVKSEVREYFLGHVSGIQWVYQHGEQLHPEDLAEEYRKVEPYVSLDFNEITARQSQEERDRQLLTLRIRKSGGLSRGS